MMNLNEAVALCKTMRRKVRGMTYYAYVEEKATMSLCFNFEGSPFWGTTKRIEVVYCRTQGEPIIPAMGGTAVFQIGADSPERVQAHWESFLKNEGAFAPRTMAPVTVSNGPGRVYRGKVVRTTGTRVLVSYKFKNGKQAANKWFKLSEVRW